MVMLYCQNNLKIEFKRKPHVDINEGITASQFTNWLESGFAKGDIVEWNGNLAILFDSTITKAVISYHVNSDNLLINDNNKLDVQVSEISPASESQIKRVVAILKNSGLEVDQTYFNITAKYIPESGELVKFTSQTTCGYGVVRTIHQDGTVIMYCYCTNSGEVKYLMHETLGNIDDFQFTTSAKVYRYHLDKALLTVNRRWSESHKHIEPVNYRVESGKPYWYINDKLKVVRATENLTPQFNFRLIAGNYFHDPSDALKIQAQLSENIRDFIAKM